MSPKCHILAYKQMLFLNGAVINYMYLNPFSFLPIFLSGEQEKNEAYIFPERIIVLKG